VIDRGAPTFTINDSGTLEELCKKISERQGLFQE